MKVCQKCQKPVPKTITVDGKKKNLQNRKFCFECSPYGCHNTKSDPLKPTQRGQLNGKVKPYSEWTQEAKDKNRKSVWERGLERKQKLVDLKGGCCKGCGYKKCIRALSFHHRDPSTKQFGLEIRSIRGLSWETVLAEVEKCDLLCLNCHMETEDLIAKENGKYCKQIGDTGFEPVIGRL